MKDFKEGVKTMEEKLNITNLDIALRMCSIQIDKHILIKIIDIVKMIEEKGEEASIRDTAKLIVKWEEARNQRS